MPTADNFRELTGENTVEGVTVNKSGKWDGTGTENGVTFSTDYGSVFFPAAGFNGGNYAAYEGAEGYYWSGESYEGSDIYVLYFEAGYAGVDWRFAFNAYSVRLVRGL